MANPPKDSKKTPEVPDVDIAPLLNKLREYGTDTDHALVRRVFEFANRAHAGQFRSSGQPYVIHPLRAATILAELKVPVSVVCAGLLHDVPEDTDITVEEIRQEFGEDIASMVEGITKLSTLKYRGIERYIENLRKMFVAMASDVRVILIKFADRMHNLETLDALPQEKRIRIALESLEIYAPIANRLGLHELRTKLEDLSFKHVMPHEYEWVKRLSDKVIKGKKPYIERVKDLLDEELITADVPFTSIQGRVKHLYSLYKKLLKNDRDIVLIHDLIAFRVIVPEVSDCYAALGIIHSRWKPLKGRIKDYISKPKPNGYRSLHTTVFCEDGEIVEFQIRTVQMHDEAERGIAAHWKYDEQGKRSVPVGRNGHMAWVEGLDAVPDEGEGAEELMGRLSHMSLDVFQNRIFVFTPKGDVIDLPEGSTPVDFAYAIHSDIGSQATFAKVNSQNIPLDRPLSSGDCCEIITDKKRQGPNPDWLDFVKTGHARNHIKSYTRTKMEKWAKKPETNDKPPKAGEPKGRRRKPKQQKPRT